MKKETEKRDKLKPLTKKEATKFKKLKEKKNKLEFRYYDFIQFLIKGNGRGGFDYEKAAQLAQYSKIKMWLSYVHELTWLKPNLVRFFNRHFNRDFNTLTTKEIISLLYDFWRIFRDHNLTSTTKLFMDRPSRKAESDRALISRIEKYKFFDSGNARDYFYLARKLNVDLDIFQEQKIGELSEEDHNLIEKIVKKKQKTSKTSDQVPVAESMQTKSQLRQTQEKVTKTTDVKKLQFKESRYIKKLTQKTLNELGLVLLDIKVLSKTDEVLLIFADKQGHKWYHKKSFIATIYIKDPKQFPGVIDCDYIQNYDRRYFRKIEIRTVKEYTRLMFIINDMYMKYMFSVTDLIEE